tara:strand:- start:608 stop:1111 length:504 start_codon:yes stop_codon:yes gene_type:complete
MIITLNNKEFTFDKVSRRSNNIVFFDNIFNKEHIISRRIEIDYDFCIDLLKLCLRSYVNCESKNRNLFDYLEELFQFFKITNNSNVKRDLVSKIGYLLINNELLLKDIKVLKMISSYSENNIYNKNDKYYKFLVLLFKQRNRDIIKNVSITEDEYFDLIDFIFDYYD